MIVNGHDENRRNPIFPGVIAEGFAQRMAADRSDDLQIGRRVFNNMKRLRAADMLVLSLAALKKVTVGTDIVPLKVSKP